MVPRKHARSKIKQLCCGDEFSDYEKIGVSKPLDSAQILAAEKIKRDIRDRIE
jgi:hypothetical protein